MSGYVFISYSHSDTTYVERLEKFLRQRGVETWLDRELVGGDQWNSVLEERIDSCAAFLVVMSDRAKKSDWVLREVTHALDRSKPVLPLLLSGNGLFSLNHIQSENVLQGEMPSDNFVVRLQQLLSGGRHASEVLDGRVERTSRSAAASGRQNGPTESRAGFRRRNLIAAVAGSSLAALGGCYVGRLILSDTVGVRLSVPPAIVPRLAAVLTDPKAVLGIAFRPDSQIMATGGQDGRVMLWDVSMPPGPRLLATLKDHTSNVDAVAFSLDGKIMATGSRDRSVMLWDVSSPSKPHRLATINEHTQSVEALVFSPDGRTMATASGDSRVIVWDVSIPSEPKLLASLPDHPRWMVTVAFGPDGKLMATSGSLSEKNIGSPDNNRVALWDMSTPSLPRRMAAIDDHTGLVEAIAFHPDGRIMATAGRDETVMVWDILVPSRPRRLATLNDHNFWVTKLAFSPDGKIMATGSYDDSDWSAG